MSEIFESKFFHRLLVALAWMTFAFIVFSTLSPLSLRPSITSNPNVERLSAFLMLGLSLGLAYPCHLLSLLAFIVILAGGSEALQLLTADRHAYLGDALIKANGGSLGIGLAAIIIILCDHDKPVP